jgi:hypothetical protein
MITLLLPALVMLVGLLLYAFAQNPKLVEVGRLAFFCGLFVLTLALGSKSIRIP